MANFKEKLLGLLDNSTTTAMTLFDTFTDTINSVDWDEQFKSLKEMKETLVQKSNDLRSEFDELLKKVKDGIKDFEVVVPFNKEAGEKLTYETKDGKLTVEVTFEDENVTRSNKTTVLIPENCDVKNITQTYNAINNTMTISIPKIMAEKEDVETVAKTAATPKKEEEEKVEEAHERESKLLKRFRENTAKASGRVVIPRSANGRFVKRN